MAERQGNAYGRETLISVGFEKQLEKLSESADLCQGSSVLHQNSPGKQTGKKLGFKQFGRERLRQKNLSITDKTTSLTKVLLN